MQVSFANTEDEFHLIHLGKDNFFLEPKSKLSNESFFGINNFEIHAMTL